MPINATTTTNYNALQHGFTIPSNKQALNMQWSTYNSEVVVAGSSVVVLIRILTTATHQFRYTKTRRHQLRLGLYSRE